MAGNPWRCSQCGTINEPVASSCRTCGKWPSLFDLEDNAIEEVELEPAAEQEAVATHEPPPEAEPRSAPEPEPIAVETFEEPVYGDPAAASEPRKRFGAPKTDPVLGEGESSRPRWVSWLVPAAVVVYFVISYFFSGR